MKLICIKNLETMACNVKNKRGEKVVVEASTSTQSTQQKGNESVSAVLIKSCVCEVLINESVCVVFDQILCLCNFDQWVGTTANNKVVADAKRKVLDELAEAVEDESSRDADAGSKPNSTEIFRLLKKWTRHLSRFIDY